MGGLTYPADAQPRNHEDAPDLVEIIDPGNCECTAAGSHQYRRDDHEQLVVTTKYGEQPQDDTRPCQDAQADGQATKPDLNGVVSIDICRLVSLVFGAERSELSGGDHELNASTGQNIRMEKKLAPLMKVMTRVRIRVRGACARRFGNIGYGANLLSQTRKPTIMMNPMIRGARTKAEVQGC